MYQFLSIGVESNVRHEVMRFLEGKHAHQIIYQNFEMTVDGNGLIQCAYFAVYTA